MKKPLWVELVSLSAFIMLIVGGCGDPNVPKPPPPKPKITITVIENSEKHEIKILYENHEIGFRTSPGWAMVSFSTSEDAAHYREQLEFAVVKLKEIEEKINSKPENVNEYIP